ncbi:MAG: alkane 1-monooxygenase, partial [Pseudomonadota bacterium]
MGLPASDPIPGIRHAMPFWASLALVPVMIAAALMGGWWILLVPAATWALFSGLDAALGQETGNLSPETSPEDLYWYRLVTLVWPPVQIVLLLALLAYVPTAEHLSAIEAIGVFFGAGVLTGTIGITYAHELMHRPRRLDR